MLDEKIWSFSRDFIKKQCNDSARQLFSFEAETTTENGQLWLMVEYLNLDSELSTFPFGCNVTFPELRLIEEYKVACIAGKWKWTEKRAVIRKRDSFSFPFPFRRCVSRLLISPLPLPLAPVTKAKYKATPKHFLKLWLGSYTDT